MNAEEMPCWWCGVEPDDVHEIRSIEGHVRWLPQWPPGDHEHSATAPTADDRFDQAFIRWADFLSRRAA